MSKRNVRLWKGLCSLALVAAIVIGVMATATGPASAKRPGPPGPLCGFTTIWDCTLPDGTVEQVIGTQCDILKYERKNRATCVPATF